MKKQKQEQIHIMLKTKGNTKKRKERQTFEA
jgi:hypothetical protein